ncbi:MAG: deoxynucleoside kinase [Fibromonadales bacterium]|nr:deoxynucleoside kinase [Fibromonadales bacterium]MCL1957700.1 deoxynucleoside kinase [Fibromonadales bacterium]
MNFVFFAIEGPIGVGKSFLLDALEKEYGRHVLHSFREEMDAGPFLTQFYEDKKKYAFQTQISFMLSRYKQCEALQKVLKQPDMFAEHRIYAADFIFEKNDIFAELTIEDEQEWKLYQNIRDILLESSKKFMKPDFVVYLRAGEDTLYRRIQSRLKQTEQLKIASGDMDKGISKDYLHRLTSLYDRYFFHYKTSPVLIIDINNVDLLNEPLNTSSIIDSVSKAIENTPTQNTYIKI